MKKKKIRSKLIKGIVIVLILLTASELFLRFYLGLGKTVLYREDKDFEYIPVASQDMVRLRKHIYYNRYSMHSYELNPKAIKILGFGDSIINGGLFMDQDSLATTRLSRELSEYFDTAVQVLNISAASWGPSNCYAYLQKYGDFNAKAIVLFVSSHDAYDNMTFEKIVGKSDYYPDKNKPLALLDLLDYVKRYVNYSIKSTTPDPFPEFKLPGAVFDPGFLNFYNYCKAKNIPFIICLHCKTIERHNHKYHEEGEEIIKFAEEHKIPLIKELDYPVPDEDYREGMHYNEAGQGKLAEMVFSYLKNLKLKN